MKLSEQQIGILRDVAANKIVLDEVGDGSWLEDQLVELIMNGGGKMLIDVQGSSVTITDAGRAALAGN